jgi:uncharacterized protein YegL
MGAPSGQKVLGVIAAVPAAAVLLPVWRVILFILSFVPVINVVLSFMRILYYRVFSWLVVEPAPTLHIPIFLKNERPTRRREVMSEDLISRLEYEDNTSQRTPCVLVLDASGSMSGASIEALNSGLKRREKELKEDVVARNRVPILAIRVGGDAREMGDWADAANFVAPTLIADGGTPLGVGMDLALQKVAEEKRLLDGAGIPSTRPWIFMISDGYPTDEGLGKSCRSVCARGARKTSNNLSYCCRSCRQGEIGTVLCTAGEAAGRLAVLGTLSLAKPEFVSCLTKCPRSSDTASR